MPINHPFADYVGVRERCPPVCISNYGLFRNSQRNDNCFRPSTLQNRALEICLIMIGFRKIAPRFNMAITVSKRIIEKKILRHSRRECFKSFWKRGRIILVGKEGTETITISLVAEMWLNSRWSKCRCSTRFIEITQIHFFGTTNNRPTILGAYIKTPWNNDKPRRQTSLHLQREL